MGSRMFIGVETIRGFLSGPPDEVREKLFGGTGSWKNSKGRTCVLELGLRALRISLTPIKA